MSPDQPITTVEMHTAGEPVRIVTGGYPPLRGATILEKRRYARDHLDHLRRMLMAEPRGHADMYGALLVEPDLPRAHLAVLFLHNEGYSTMCGHAVIALGRFAVERGLVEAREPETEVRIQCPCGLVTTTVEVADGRAGRVRFASVPAFAFARDAVVVTARSGRSPWTLATAVPSTACCRPPPWGSTWSAARSRGWWRRRWRSSMPPPRRFPLSHPDEPRSRLLLRGHPDRRHERQPRCRHDQCLRVRRRAGRPQPDRLRRHGQAGPDAPPPRGRNRAVAPLSQHHRRRVHRPGAVHDPGGAASSRVGRGRRRGLLHRRGGVPMRARRTRWAAGFLLRR